MNLQDDPNREILSLIAHILGNLCGELVFVGGCATGLLVTTIRAQTIRMTEDVDLVARVTTAQEYHAAESRLASKGFEHDISSDAPICRWHYKGIKVDLMPSGTDVLGFHNRWYPLAIDTAERVTLEDGMEIRLINAPTFIGTKLEAFKDRGNNDFLLSHDLEDIIMLPPTSHSDNEAIRGRCCSTFPLLFCSECKCATLVGSSNPCGEPKCLGKIHRAQLGNFIRAATAIHC